jgi:hypothetical protein
MVQLDLKKHAQKTTYVLNDDYVVLVVRLFLCTSDKCSREFQAWVHFVSIQ